MNKFKKLIVPLLVFMFLIPFVVFGETEKDEIVKTIEAVTKWIITVSAGLAILMYTVGGFLWMSDAGNAERVKMAKSIIVSTTIGLVIILLASGIASAVSGLVK